MAYTNYTSQFPPATTEEDWLFHIQNLVFNESNTPVKFNFRSHIYQLFTHMKLGSNIAVKNVLQVYVTTTTIFYAISLKKKRWEHMH